MPDIFISYAHADNNSLIHHGDGWVTNFTKHLRTQLTRKMGREDNYSFWKDDQLQGNHKVTAEIEQQVKDAEILLIMLSPGWISAPWCKRELDIFQASHQDVNNRIFVVELDRIEEDSKPGIIQDLRGYRFWYETNKGQTQLLGYPVPKQTDEDYLSMLLDLSSQLSNELKCLLQPSKKKLSIL